VNASIVGLSSEGLPEFEYSCGASNSPTLLRLRSSRFHPFKNLKMVSCHIPDSELPVRSGRWKFPLVSAVCTRPAVSLVSINPDGSIVQPETLVCWHRAGFRCYWRRKSARSNLGPADLSAARFHPVLQLTERKECYASGLPLQEPTSLFALQRNFWTGLVVRIASGIGSPHIIPFARSVADGF